jgi:hypothetical protein
MRGLPLEGIRIYLAEDGTVIVGAHEHNGYIWWSRLPDPLNDPVVRRDFERVGVDLVDGRPVV